MEQFVERKDQLFAIEIGVIEGGWIGVDGIVEGSEVGEGGEIVAIEILDDACCLITVEIAVADQDVLLSADGFFEVEGDESVFGVCCDRVDALPAPVGGDAEA